MLTLSGIYAMIIPDSINQNMERFNHREKGSLAAEHLLEEFANEAEIDHVPSSIVPMGDDPFLMYQLLPMLETDDELNCKYFINNPIFFLTKYLVLR